MCTYLSASRYDAASFLYHRIFELEHKLMVTATGQVLAVDDIRQFYDNDLQYFDLLFEFQTQLHKLNLNEEEAVIIAALCVLLTGNYPFFVGLASLASELAPCMYVLCTKVLTSMGRCRGG